MAVFQYDNGMHQNQRRYIYAINRTKKVHAFAFRECVNVTI